MKNSILGALVGLILLASHMHVYASTIRWQGIDWVYNERWTIADVQGEQLLISNPYPEKNSRGSVVTPRGFFDPASEMDQFIEITFIDPYLGSDDDSMFYLFASLSTAIKSYFGIFTSATDRYVIRIYSDHAQEWNRQRTAGSHTLGMYYAGTRPTKELRKRYWLQVF